MKNNKKNLRLILGIFIFFIILIISFFDNSSNDLLSVIVLQIIYGIPVSFFIFFPLSIIFSKGGSIDGDLFKKLFLYRMLILLILDFIVGPDIILLENSLLVFSMIMLFPTVLFISIFKGIKNKNSSGLSSSSFDSINSEVRCSNCNAVLSVNDKFCTSCGQIVEEKVLSHDLIVKPSDFDEIYNHNENEVLYSFINREIANAGIDLSLKMLPNEVLKRKKVLNGIFVFLLFIYICMFFFHFPSSTYVLGFIILALFLLFSHKFDFISYIKKQVKSRPQEKISNIIMYEKNNLVKDNSNLLLICGIVISIILPMMLFFEPRIFYEKNDDGYAVRFYAYGITNYKSVTIPEEYKGEKVVSLRGNTFSNMKYLESVSLPDSIVEIRGQAFKNCVKLKNVNIPSKLVYLGGGAFYNAKSLESISLPDSLTYMGGETFYGASSLENVKLSENLTEIRGDSFELCTSLKSINIPDKVTRIGGHAFYGDTNLSEVIISENSMLEEIGSSAFRQCDSLKTIYLPSKTTVGERAFKESPTIVNRYNSNKNLYNFNENN